MIDPEYLNTHLKKVETWNGKFIQKLKKRFPKGIDEEVVDLDEKAFSRINCLSCANCCKTISPVFKERDIVRLSGHFKMRPSQFTEKFLFMDADGDYVLQSTPCVFLGADNICGIYEIRPAACRSFPHTNTLKFTKNTGLFVKNSAVCPAVYEIAEALKKKYQVSESQK